TARRPAIVRQHCGPGRAALGATADLGGACPVPASGGRLFSQAPRAQSGTRHSQPDGSLLCDVALRARQRPDPAPARLATRDDLPGGRATGRPSFAAGGGTARTLLRDEGRFAAILRGGVVRNVVLGGVRAPGADVANSAVGSTGAASGGRGSCRAGSAG